MPTTSWRASTSSRCCTRTPSKPVSTGPLPPVERIESGRDQCAQMGRRAAAVVFLHGGGQNAHTWDTVIVGLGEPALAVDLPGHGRSAWRDDGDYGPMHNAETAAARAARMGTRPQTSSSGIHWAG